MNNGVWLFLGLPLLGGCVSLEDLNDQSLRASGKFSVITQNDPCSDEAGSRPALLEPQNNDVHFEKFLESMNKSNSMSDFELGKAILSSTDKQPSSLKKNTQNGPKLLGMDLEQFTEDPSPITEDGAVGAEKTLELMPVERADITSTKSTEDGDDVSVSISRLEMDKFVRNLAETTAKNGWTSSFVKSLGAFQRVGGYDALKSGNWSEEKQLALQDLTKKYLLAAYFKAYFRDGAVIKLEVLEQALRDSIHQRIGGRISDPAVRDGLNGDIDNIVDLARAQICKGAAGEPCFAFGVIGDATFVTRAGKSYGFPGITGQFAPASGDTFSLDTPDWNPVIGDLVRIVVEATGDAAFGVPGTQNSTACAKLQRLCGSEADAATITHVNEVGDRTEASAKSATSIAIRGGWLFSLNNEALATAIETFVSVSSRKAAERAAWSQRQACPSKALDVSYTPYKTVEYELR